MANGKWKKAKEGPLMTRMDAGRKRRGQRQEKSKAYHGSTRMVTDQKPKKRRRHPSEVLG
jgi:hypothetical protein